MNRDEYVKAIHDAGGFERLEDGFYYYAQTGLGVLSEHNLRAIAEELARLNKEMNDRVSIDQPKAVVPSEERE